MTDENTCRSEITVQETDRKKQLFHFTMLLYLPTILREGITRGETPVDPTLPYDKVPKAANLTTNGDRNSQLQIWAAAGIDKTRVRLRVEVPLSELISYRQLRDRFAIKSKWVKLLAPYHERKHWFYAFEGVRPNNIVAVELWDGQVYRPIAGAELERLVADIEIETERAFELTVVPSGRMKGAMEIRTKRAMGSSWLLDGVGMPPA